MFALAAFVLFVVAGVLQGSGAHTNSWLSPIALICYGLACLALHVSGRVKS
jgi:hypothetical protein